MPLKQCDRHYINPILLSDLEKTSPHAHTVHSIQLKRAWNCFHQLPSKKISVNYDANNSIGTNPLDAWSRFTKTDCLVQTSKSV